MKPSTALVTGASKRIGREIALDLARAGWAVGVHYNSSADQAAQTVSEIEAAGGRAAALEADLLDPAAVSALVPGCCETLGAPACLINNASLFEHDDIQGMSAESYARHMQINLTAPVFLSQAMAAALPVGEPGLIINILDQRVWKFTPEYFSYSLAKSALWTATRTMAQGLAPGIRVNAIGPGPTLPNERQSEAAFTRQQQSTVLERGPEVSEICSAVRFIIDAPSMTGQMIAIDGGQHLAWRTPDIYDHDPDA